MLANTFTLEHIETNGINVRAAVEGSGPLVILVHGWPELWYSWRHQIRSIANAGFKVVAPDVRGYGGSDKPRAIEAYDMIELTRDIVGLIDAFSEEKAILVGHDWGAPMCWNTAVLHPQRVKAVAGLSVPHFQRGTVSAIELWKQIYHDRFFYQLYFQREGVAEVELEADVASALRKIYFMGSGDPTDEERHAVAQKSPSASFLDGLTDPDPFPDWLTDEDLAYFVRAFEKGGFRGPLNRYRAMQRDWELLPQLSHLTVDQPSCFIAGTLDLVRYFIPGFDPHQSPGMHCTDFRGSTLIQGKGHWIQQEAPDQVTRALLSFLGEVF